MRPPMAYNRLVTFFVLLVVFGRSECALNNRPPQFLPGGDMARFSLSEDTPVGKSVYKLSAIDPEGSRVSYTVSGQHLNIDRSTGIVTLAKRLDREVLDSLEVVISVTDEPIKDSDANTVSLRREIAIIDVNDNAPEFVGRPYSFSVSEDTRVGTIIYNNITVVDKDIGPNSEITMTCIQNTEPCVTFNLLTEKVSMGTYVGSIRLARPLDFDTVSSYKLTVKATDGGLKNPLSSTANISVVVKDVQDERPVFTNSPYSIVIDENTPAGVQVLKVTAEDGDAGFKRPVVLSLEDDSLGYFTIDNESNGTAYIFTSDNPIDRENKIVSDAGGIYTFRLKATELINNELPGDVSYEIVTVVVQDVDDEKPEFNERSFTTSVSEDISIGTPLPGLNIIVNDKDLGDNGRYVLVMRTQDSRVSNWFKIIPETALGRSTVLIRLIDNDGFDYDAGVTDVEFDIVAMYQDNLTGGFKEASAAHVQVNVLDANDNLPKFTQTTYAYSIPENLVPGTSIANLTASDIDSGIYGEITYSLQGFGMDKFGSDPEFGGIYLTGKVDYEQQSSYSLTLEAKDGGNRSTHVVILVEIVDVNDNTPVFNSLEYKRTIREGGTEFQPKFFVQASDADSGLNSMIRYSVASSNYDGVVLVNHISGELTLNSPVNSSHTSRGQYELVIRATDLGMPPLHADTNVYVRVGVPGNQRPMFKNLTYSVTIPENTPRTTEILKVRATDPDGPDHLIEYSMVNSNDNFHINKKTGAISVSERAILDLDSTGLSYYHLVVMAMDSGLPIREVAHSDVYVNVTDVNNKPPKFDDNVSYIVYVPEITEIGEIVYKVNAVDPDKNASIKYAIVEPIKANDKTGLPLKNTSSYNFKDVFSINKLTGEIKVNSALSYQMASVIVLTIRAVDTNAVDNVHEQYDEVEITFFVKPYMNKNPVFTNAGWSADGDSSTLIVRVDEETPIGTELVQLKAIDVLTNESLYDFKAVTAVPRQIAMDYAGKVILTERLDYETLENKTLTFQVKVTTEDGERSTSKTIVIEVQDINDNSPEFEYPIYRTSLVESSPKGTVVLSVRANDKDLPTSQNGIVRYHLGGENSNLFTVDRISGEIQVSGNGVIDREKTPILKLMVFASDTPQGGPHQKITSVPVHIDVKDINDNAPEFDSSIYIAVVLENVVPETSVLNVSAHDPDEGSAGLVHYKLIDEQQLQGFFYINPTNGQIKTTKRLTGKGRSDPYEMKIRAEDNGEPGMFSDVKLSLYISDIIENDGVPTFVHPTADEIAYVSENASIGSLVFRALATDPDDPNTLEGTIHYSFLEETKDSLIFSIDSETGLITTTSILDREMQDKYTLVLVARDLGSVPQQSTKVFNVIITDVDDNKPVFNRSIEEKPLMMEIEEESSHGTLVGSLEAYDPDIGENALIDYIITDGNNDNVFYLNSSNNVAEIRINGEIDRESISEYVLTIKCFKHKTKAYNLHKSYNKQDPSERQVVIKVLDIDDNLPKFIDENLTLGVRVSVPLDTLVATIQATDVDSLAEQITYHITNLTFAHRLESPKEIKSWPFFLDQLSGQIRTTSSMSSYSEGYFNIVVAAINSDVPGRHSNTTIKVFIVKDRGLLKFVFTRPPNVVGHYIKKFKEDVEKSLGIPQASLNLYDTQFYSKNDGSLDFSSTGSCFQLVGPNNYNPKDTISLLEDPSNHELKNVYKQYEVKNIERCSPKQVKSAVTWVQISVLGIATFIGLISIFSICLLCCSYKKWKRLR